MKTSCMPVLVFTVLLAGSAFAEPERDGLLPVVYEVRLLSIPNEVEFEHPFGEDQPLGQKIRELAVSSSAILPNPDAEHVTVQLVPFVHVQAYSRPLDLRLEQAQLGAFINYVADGKVQWSQDKRKLIPLESIEQNLSTLCHKLGIENVTISRGMGWQGTKSQQGNR